MGKGKKKKELSAFAQAALALDQDFRLFEELAGQVGRLDINSDRGLDRARTLLAEVDACRVRLGEGMQALATTLDEARQRTDAAAQTVAARAGEIQERHDEAEHMLARFAALGQLVQQVNDSVAALRTPTASEVTDADRALMANQLPEINARLGELVDAARQLMEDAQQANMQRLARKADSLRQSLQTSLHRLNQFVERHT